jgi:MoaA/NifB/PqqE/SkfB family radical SAM enzyme
MQKLLLKNTPHVAGSDAKDMKPFILNISAHSCNNNCFFCNAAGRKQSAYESFEKIITKLRVLKHKKTAIIRGLEPALRKDILKIIKEVKKRAQYLILESNGRIFYYEDYCKLLLGAGIDEFRIYVTGDKDSHNATTQGSFEQTITGITNLKNLGANVVLLYQITKDNYYRLPNIVELCKKLDIDKLSLVYIGVSSEADGTVDHTFFHSAAKYVSTFMDELRDKNITLAPHYYPEFVELTALFNDIKKDEVITPPKLSKKDNWMLTTQNIRLKKFALDNYPRWLYLELTGNCNFRCTMCPMSMKPMRYDANLDMPFSLFKKIADDLFPYAKYVDLRGYGETTVMRNWENYLDYALKFSCEYGLITNLAVRNDKMWEKMVKNDFFLGISFDGATKRTFEMIRKGSNFENILRNLRLVSDARKKFGRKDDRLKIMTVAQRENIHELPAIVKIAKEYGIGYVQFSPSRVLNEDGYLDRDSIFQEQNIVKPILKECMDLAKSHNVELTLTGSFESRELEDRMGQRLWRQCYKPWFHLYIAADGMMGPCNQLMNPDGILLGDLKRQTFFDAWNSFEFRLFRKMILTHNKLNRCDWCHRCRYND